VARRPLFGSKSEPKWASERFFYTTNQAEYHNAVFNLGYGAVGVTGAVLPHAFRDGAVPFYRLFGPV